MRTLALAGLLALVVVPARAEDPFGGFQQFSDRASLKPFTRDLGGIIGAATFHGGRSLGFSGFDIGIRAGAQFYPSKGNAIMRNRGTRAFGLPWVQAEIGLPFKIDGFIRGVSYQGLTIAGGGVRYGIYSGGDMSWAPQLLASVVGHSVVHQHFSASHFGASLVGSMGTPVVAPYLGAGFDRTRLVARSSTLDPTIVGEVTTAFEPRFTLGVRIKPKQFAYLNLAATLAHNQPGAEAGLGIRF